MVVHRWSSVVALATTLLVACGDSTRVRTSTDKSDNSDASFARRDTNRTLGPGDIRIYNADSSFEVALVRDSIVAGFGPKTLAQLRKSTDTSAVDGSGFAANIEKLVKSTVASALDREVEYAVADVQRVEYDDGKLQFFWKDGSRMKLFENTKQDDKPVSETFKEPDARAFVAAFDARKATIARER